MDRQAIKSSGDEMRMMNKTELKRKIARAMDKAKMTQKLCLNSEHRQIIETGLKAEATAETLFAVFEALKGNPVFLNIMAGK